MALTKKDLVVVAVARLGGARRVVATEDVAIAAHDIDERAFGWKKYPDRVDLDVVRVTLRHEGETKQPRVEGSVQHGWHLTPLGVAWIDRSRGLLEGELDPVDTVSAAAQSRRAETRERGAALNRVLNSEAFGLWRGRRDFTNSQAAAVFRIDEYTPERDRTRKAAQLQELIRGNPEIEEFIREAIPSALALTPPSGRQEA